MLLIGFLLLVSACAPAPRTIPAAQVAPTKTLTAMPSSAATEMPVAVTSSPSETPIPCDPLVAEYCITDGYFLFARPILPPGDDSVEETYRFASTAAGTREPHHGVEFINGTGTPVHAAADGQVIFAGPDEEAVYSPWPNFYGNVIVLRHADALFTLYAHLSVVDVKAGEDVQGGEKIGEVGLTGSANGSHLHFEVRRGEVEDYFSTLNPELWLMPRPGKGALAISVMDTRGQYQRAEITVQSELASYFISTYHAEFPLIEENAALGELAAGRYRIALLFNGTIFERWVEVEAGKLTRVVVVVE